jgi:hypothetical protein
MLHRRRLFAYQVRAGRGQESFPRTWVRKIQATISTQPLKISLQHRPLVYVP